MARGGAFIAALILGAALLLVPTKALSKAPAANDVPNELVDSVNGGINDMELSLWQEYYDALPQDARDIFGSGGVGELIAELSLGNSASDGSDILTSLKNSLLDAVKVALSSLSLVICTAFMSGIMRTLADGGGDGLRNITAFACFSLAAAVIAYDLAALMETASATIRNLTRFMEILTPVTAVVLSASGSTVLSGMVSPATSFLTGAVASAFYNVILPLIVLGGAIAIVNSLMGKVKLDKLFTFIKSALKWLIGAIFTVYLGTVSVRGLSAGTIDSITLRTAKYTIDKSVPIIGSAVSGTLDNVLGGAAILKSAVGLAGTITVIATVLSPLLRICATCAAARLLAALCEPLGDERMPKLLSATADVCNYLFAAVTAVGLMCIISLGIMTAASGL